MDETEEEYISPLSLREGEYIHSEEIRLNGVRIVTIKTHNPAPIPSTVGPARADCPRCGRDVPVSKNGVIWGHYRAGTKIRCSGSQGAPGMHVTEGRSNGDLS